MRAAKLFFLCIILILASWLIYSNWEELSASLELPFQIIALACFFSFTNLVISAEQLRWCLERDIRKNLSFQTWFRYFVAGRLANTVLAESGTIYRAVQLRSDHSVFVHQFLAANVAAAWLNIQVASGLGLLVLPLSGLFYGRDAFLAGFTLFLLFSVFVIGPACIQQVLKALDPSRFEGSRVFHFTKRLLAAFYQIASDRKAILAIVSLGVANIGVAVVVIHLVGSSLLYDMSVSAAIYLALALKVSTLVSVTPGNIGVREVIIEVALHVVTENVIIGSGVILSLALRAIGLMVVLPLGSIFFMLENRKQSELP